MLTTSGAFTDSPLLFSTRQRNDAAAMKRKTTGIIGENWQRISDQTGIRNNREKNYRCKEGEVDIIAKEKRLPCFFEVRAKNSLMFGSPEESVTPQKERASENVAARYQQTHECLPVQWRIDFVAVELDRAGKPATHRGH